MSQRKRKSSPATSPHEDLPRKPIQKMLGLLPSTVRAQKPSPENKKSKGILTSVAPPRTATRKQRAQEYNDRLTITSTTPSSTNRLDKELVPPRVISLPGYTTTGSLPGYTIPKRTTPMDVVIHDPTDDEFSD